MFVFGKRVGQEQATEEIFADNGIELFYIRAADNDSLISV